ncbi:RdgB/HAM1 family non-canonical purine NTP pyrophosphatase [Desulfurispira natronophila]|uniref:dITP/XTP pyrophosphatase n=1 Tax=Desulfurispira natronophila TaxID=682562 RepID=A0A7W7Y4X1_9BACT|nr:RdgB/HAM1 family non-canonical purine NTP pyrophosphatase [Desulfurispira natronophila]MBB5021852.1 XTP/dITP diphosphohydrolase [Desulfurispira natronophila]
MRIILASKNTKKLLELRAILREAGAEVFAPQELDIDLPEVDEDGDTFVENALKKARSAHKASGLAAIADDSGLCVDALSGAPGVHSARFAGIGASDEDNNHKLLQQLAGNQNRRGRFACAIAYVDSTTEHWVEGFCEGRILEHPRGDGGFGYDPLFLPDGYQQTFGELPFDVKNGLSHRYQASAALRDWLQSHTSPSAPADTRPDTRS